MRALVATQRARTQGDIATCCSCNGKCTCIVAIFVLIRMPAVRSVGVVCGRHDFALHCQRFQIDLQQAWTRFSRAAMPQIRRDPDLLPN